MTRRLRLAGAEPWAPRAPRLYSLSASLGDDDMVERIGLREIRVEGRDLLLNGEPLRLLGFNRHDSHPQFGCGLPEALLAADVQILQDLGANFVRGSHYPQDPRFLDLCDEAGLLVWSEAIGWQHTAAHLNDPRFIEAQLLDIGEMIAGAANHPSVILWGLLNESLSQEPASRGGYERLIGRDPQARPDAAGDLCLQPLARRPDVRPGRHRLDQHVSRVVRGASWRRCPRSSTRSSSASRGPTSRRSRRSCRRSAREPSPGGATRTARDGARSTRRP